MYILNITIFKITGHLLNYFVCFDRQILPAATQTCQVLTMKMRELFLKAITHPPPPQISYRKYYFQPKSKLCLVIRTIWLDIVRLFVLLSVKPVLQNITWKENKNQKVSKWGHCAKFWMNAGTETRKYVKIVDCQKCGRDAWESQKCVNFTPNAWSLAGLATPYPVYGGLFWKQRQNVDDLEYVCINGPFK